MNTVKTNTIKTSNNNLKTVKINNVPFFKIKHIDKLRPFLMSLVSPENHWIFIGSNGGLSAGRKNAEHALFPYYTDDKIIESAEITGSKTLLQFKFGNETYLWEPFSDKQIKQSKVTRNLYKSWYGNQLIFEEINHDIECAFQYQWSTSAKYGFVKTSSVKNLNSINCTCQVLDGIQNIVPQGVGSELQNRASNLVDAYKRNELHNQTGLALFSLSAVIVDKAEPSESLKTNMAWSLGLSNPKYLLSTLQLNQFRQNQPLETETDIKGEKGAYFVNDTFVLDANQTKTWHIVADVNKTQSNVVNCINVLKNTPNLESLLLADINQGTQKLIGLNASADGLQLTADKLNDARHFANVLFNIMRGGVVDYNYQIEEHDFIKYLKNANLSVFNSVKTSINSLPKKISLTQLQNVVTKLNNASFTRLATEYLPLKFSRRHGDPSRPWNKFSINTQSEIDGSKILDYEGNWRDIFQNWEALAHAFPQFMEGMLFKFLNATTFDGYNPYRVTKDGFDWETIEPDDPWSYIGYWGDHQIIYLLKFLEFLENHNPNRLSYYFNTNVFVYANVPYTIKPYNEIVNNPKDTINFNHKADAEIRKEREKTGADGALLTVENGNIYQVNLIEKLLATVLAKMSNFIPEGGIWMNTQRPEWNDANNALVGNGVSMVTLYYLHRFLKFFNQLLEKTDIERIKISGELIDFYKGVRKTLLDNEQLLDKPITNANRKTILDTLGTIASDYRMHIYQTGFWGKKRSISISGLKNFIRVNLAFIEHSIRANERADGMFHAYNLMTYTSQGVIVDNLDEMLEGQVAVLSAKCLNPKQALNVLDALKNSALFRNDQYSYMLYPNKKLPGFLQKNNVPKNQVIASKLLSQLVALGNQQIIEQDVLGNYHFNGNFRNAKDLENALQSLAHTKLQPLVKAETDLVLTIYESVFNHKAFTGRSGTFFGYEGLGSIYWHMVSKLLLAVQECCLQAIETNENAETIGRLLEHYYEIEAGIGVHKSPELYGAFPTDPYSHTPAGKGAQQPGMTGQVKEDIISRWGELGVFVKQGALMFYPCMLRKTEFLTDSVTFNYINVIGETKQLSLDNNMLAFTYCQVPVVYSISSESFIEINLNNGTTEKHEGYKLNKALSQEVFNRTHAIERINVNVNAKLLK